MPEIRNPTKSKYYIARNADGSVLHVGRTGPGQVTVTGQPFLDELDDDQSLLANAATWADQFAPLPAVGESVEAGELYQHDSGVVMARQSHIRTSHAPSEIPALFSVAREQGALMEWVANEPVMVGDQRIYEGDTYACVQSHTTQEAWPPPVVPALWSIVAPETDEWAPGQTVVVGDLRDYQGTTYRCLQAHTTQAGWTPPAVPALWEAV